MNIETRKLTFIQEFLRLQNEEIVIDLEKLLHKGKAELLEKEMKPMSQEKLNSDIDQSLEDSKNGRIISASSLKTKIRKWS
ncbi:hypothetical protein [Flavobacterium sp.]|jgi:hypothetical protein|uniref:hypothetical protein n=1 Tax=Flavobacterium sp. TaxID=239 RepID=UPI0037BEC707